MSTQVLILKDKDLWRLLLLGTFTDTDIKDLENYGVISSLMELSDSGSFLYIYTNILRDILF